MNKNKLTIVSYLYLIIPIIVFCIGWLKPIVSIPATITLTIIIVLKIVEVKREKTENFISKKALLIIFGLIIFICITAGQGNLFYQSSDWHWRNAVYRDLINIKWPVYYENSNAIMTYYIGFWMLPAVIGKITLLVFGERIAWIIGNIALLIWCALGVLLSILWIIKSLKIKGRKKLLLTIIVFFGFSGLDILGVFLFKNTQLLKNMHIEWWADTYQFSSIITQLFWVFNQSVVAWLITIMFINEKKINNYLLLILLALPYGPIPFVGLIPLFAIRGIKFLIEVVKENRIAEFIRDMFSVQNILALITILPIYYLYYCNNEAVSSGSFRFDNDLLNLNKIIKLFVFYLFEIGFYVIILAEKNKKNELFWGATIALMFIPMFRIGLAGDFAMRASIPSIVVILYYLIEYMLNMDTQKIINKLLVVIFIFGCITPCLEYARAITTIIRVGKINAVSDALISFSDKTVDGYENFLSSNQKLFKYISK